MDKMLEVERAAQLELRQSLRTLFQGAIRLILTDADSTAWRSPGAPPTSGLSTSAGPWSGRKPRCKSLPSSTPRNTSIRCGSGIGVKFTASNGGGIFGRDRTHGRSFVGCHGTSSRQPSLNTACSRGSMPVSVLITN